MTTTINYEKLGTMIKNKRTARGLTQAEFVNISGVSIKTLTRLEKGHCENVTLKTLNMLADALSVPVSQMIEQSESETQDTESEYEKEDEYNRIISAINYTNQDPYHHICTFAELILALPLMDYAELMNWCVRIDGAIFNFESYMAQCMDGAWRGVKPSPSKNYVEKMLNIIKSRPWENSDLPVPLALRDEQARLMKTDPDFPDEEKAYQQKIRQREEMAWTLKKLFYAISEYQNDEH